MSNSGRSSLLREDYTHTSFSSSLLEQIYLSFDNERDINNNHNYNHNSNDNNNRKYHDGYRMKKSSSTTTYLDRHDGFNLNCWIVDDKLNPHRPIYYSSSVSSSDSSTSITGGFSSSDMESMYGSRQPRLRTVRTVTNPPETRRKSDFSDEVPNKKKKLGGNNFRKRALKLYGDLKKVKQPISPGGKLASFLNSIFNNGGGWKRPKMNGCDLERESVERERVMMKTTTARLSSCLSKTPSSAGRFERRSVRFVDEEEVRSHVTRSCDSSGADVAARDWSLDNDEEFRVLIREKERRVEDMAKELLKNYRKNKELIKVNIVMRDNNGRKIIKNKIDNVRKFEEDDVDEDDVSCCSSDLFELDHLLDIDDDRYQKELPVYETTHVDTNIAIANGYII